MEPGGNKKTRVHQQIGIPAFNPGSHKQEEATKPDKATRN